MSKDNNNAGFPENNDTFKEEGLAINQTGMSEADENITQEINGVQSNVEAEQYANMVQSNQFQPFSNDGQFSEQQTAYEQSNQQSFQNTNQHQFDNNHIHVVNTPQTKKKFYKNPVNWVIFLTAILAVIFAVKFLGANTDYDDDGLTRLEEVETYKTNPRKADTDSDGFNDFVEIDLGTDPNVKAISMGPGTWIVGEDIEPGTYNMMCMKDEKGDATVQTETGEEKEVYEMGEGLLRDGTSVQVELEAGDTIEVEDSLSVIYFEKIE